MKETSHVFSLAIGAFEDWVVRKHLLCRRKMELLTKNILFLERSYCMRKTMALKIGYQYQK